MAPQSPSQPHSGALPGSHWEILAPPSEGRGPWQVFHTQSVPLSPCRAPCLGLGSRAVDRSQGPALVLFTPRSCGESFWMFVNPRNGWQNGTAPVLFLGPLEKCRPQSGPARGIHSIFWTPVTWPQPTWPYQGPLLQASSGLGTQGGHRPGSLALGAQLAWVLSELGWAGLAEDGAWWGAGGHSRCRWAQPLQAPGHSPPPTPVRLWVISRRPAAAMRSTSPSIYYQTQESGSPRSVKLGPNVEEV